MFGDCFCTCRHLIKFCNEVYDMFPVGMFLLKVNNGNTGAMCETSPKFPKRPQIDVINPVSASPTKWSNTLKQFVSCCRQTAWVCLIILWGWRLKVWRLSGVLIVNSKQISHIVLVFPLFPLDKYMLLGCYISSFNWFYFQELSKSKCIKIKNK